MPAYLVSFRACSDSKVHAGQPKAMALAGDGSLFLVASLQGQNCNLSFCCASANGLLAGRTPSIFKTTLAADLVQVMSRLGPAGTLMCTLADYTT